MVGRTRVKKETSCIYQLGNPDEVLSLDQAQKGLGDLDNFKRIRSSIMGSG